MVENRLPQIISIRRMVEILNSNKIQILNHNTNTNCKKYLNNPNIQPIHLNAIPNYKIVAILVLIETKLSLILSYNDKYVIINNEKIQEINNLYAYFEKNKVPVCEILFEHNNCQEYINKLHDDYTLMQNNKQTSEQKGGFYDKYIKYKYKYMLLKQLKI